MVRDRFFLLLICATFSTCILAQDQPSASAVGDAIPRADEGENANAEERPTQDRNPERPDIAPTETHTPEATNTPSGPGVSGEAGAVPVQDGQGGNDNNAASAAAAGSSASTPLPAVAAVPGGSTESKPSESQGKLDDFFGNVGGGGAVAGVPGAVEQEDLFNIPPIQDIPDFTLPPTEAPPPTPAPDSNAGAAGANPTKKASNPETPTKSRSNKKRLSGNGDESSAARQETDSDSWMAHWPYIIIAVAALASLLMSLFYLWYCGMWLCCCRRSSSPLPQPRELAVSERSMTEQSVSSLSRYGDGHPIPALAV